MVILTGTKTFKIVNGDLYEVTSKGLVKSKENVIIKEIKEIK